MNFTYQCLQWDYLESSICIDGTLVSFDPDDRACYFQGLPGPAGGAGEAGKAGDRVSSTH